MLWKRIRQRITLKYKDNKGQPRINIVIGKDFTNPRNIANAFNNVFTYVGPNLSKTIPQSKKKVKSFLFNSLLNLFVLKPVIHDHVRKHIIPQLNDQKALGPTSILVTLLKDNIDVLVRILTLILNQLFEQGIFFEILKIAVILTIHKKEDTVTDCNYRPISSIYVFSKIIIEFIMFSVYIN